MDLYIYDSELDFLGIVDGFISLIWINRYHEAGSFELYVAASSAHAELLKPYRYVYRPDVGEAMYISGIEDSDDPDSGRCIRVSGYGVEGILRKRVIHTVNKNTVPMLDTVSSVLSTSPIPKLEINTGDALDTVSIAITSDYMGVTLEDFLYNGCVQGDRDIGYKIDLDPEKGRLWLSLYAGRDLTDEVVFSDEFGNVNNMQYAYSEDGCANVVICKCGTVDEDVEYTSPLPSYTLGTAEGLERSEMYLTVDGIVKEGTRWHGTENGGYWETYKYLDKDATVEAMKNAADAAASDFTESYSADAICTGYRSEWAVGDIVVVRNDFRGDNLVKRIEEVQETFDTSGVTIAPTFGEPLKTIVDLISNSATSSSVKTTVSASSSGGYSNATDSTAGLMAPSDKRTLEELSEEIDTKADKSEIPTKVSELENDGVYLTNALITGNQTTVSTADGGKNVYTFTDAFGNTTELEVYNGSKGTNGTTPTIKAAAGTNINSVGTPTVSASTSGTTTTFTFDYLKGATGAKGDTGAQGESGTGSSEPSSFHELFMFY